MVLLLGLVALTAHPAHAQGGNIDIIMGTVRDAAGKPVVGARVEAFSIETEVTRPATTNDKGEYRIFFPDGTGSYRISVKAIGKTPKIYNVTRQSDDDRIVLDINLGEQAAKLDALVATANRRPDANGNENTVTAAEQSRSINGDQAMRLPIDAGDLAALAALAPGVVMTTGSDSTAATFSVAGQSAAGNTYVVNGQTTTNSNVPQDAVRNTRVITNSYDVARGNFSGGMVSVTTKGGSNRVSGSVSSQLQDQTLAWGGNTGNAFGAGSTQGQVGAGFGGPIKRNKMWIFGSFSANRQVQPIPTLIDADAATLSRLGASPDSVAKFIGLVGQTGYTQQVGAVNDNRKTDRFNGITRFDMNLGAVHVLTFTGQLNLGGQDPARIGSTSLPQVGGTTNNNGGAGNLALASRFSNGMINAFRLGYTYSASTSTPFLYVPSGRVINYSSVDSGVAPVTLGFGGNSGMPSASHTKTTELTNELSLLSGTGSHRYALGLYGNTSSFDQNSTNNQFGSFTYNSLADFENNIPSSFTRTLSPTIHTGSVYNEAIYVSDAWRPRKAPPTTAANAAAGAGGPGGFGGGRGGRGGTGGGNLQINYGLRLEHSSYGGAPARNDSVYNEFGVDTHVLPTETYLSPRAGFSYSIAAPEQQGQSQRGFAPPLLTIRGGAGIFRATMPSTLPAQAQSQSGLAGSQQQLFCTGAGVPIPDFADYLDHPEDIPAECVNNANTPVINGTPNITSYDPRYGAAKTKRLSLGLTRRITQRVSFNVDASYVRGVGQGASRDLNLVDNARFTLADEGNRPVYADPSQIVTSNGVVPLTASRKDIAFGSVTQVFSTLQNETKQLTFNVQGTTSKQIQLSLSYTLMAARDQGGSGGGFGGGNLTAGNPNEYDWATSSNDRRNQFQVNVSWPITPSFELTSNIAMLSGAAYTPVVNGDINGDGSRGNDRAFIFNPATTSDTALANGISRLMASTSGNARACLQAQLGQIAGRNTCRGPWQPSLALAMNWRPGLFQRRLAVKFQTVNLLGGLDELINGDNNIKGWGVNSRPDNTLLTVTGFNPATNQFVYSVNQRFGNTSSAATSVRSPFQLQVGLNYAIGYDPRTLQIQALARGLGGAANGSTALDTAIVRFKRASVASAALARKDSLVLTKDQITALQALVDSSNMQMQHQVDSLRPEVDKVTKAGSAADINVLQQKIRPFSANVFQIQTKTRDAVQKILTDVQWALLPDSVKNVQFNLFANPQGQNGQDGFGGGGFGGGRGGGGFGGGRGGGL